MAKRQPRLRKVFASDGHGKVRSVSMQFRFALVALCSLAAWVPAHGADPGFEFFEKKIRPVLVEHCYSCHSAEAKKLRAKLALDTREGTRKGGESGPALGPGKSDASLLIKAVRYTDEALKMPPKGKLPPAVVASLEQWVAMGAPDPRTGPVSRTGKKPETIDIEEGRKFWAFQPPKRRPTPSVQDTAWPRGDIDRFVLARLEAHGLRPAADADRVTLIRRVYFDLIGLPPTPEQIDAFVSDHSPSALARAVDQLLASPHFGERWGRHWLDVARYADSSGGGRSLLFPDAWRYRDYVIVAFNNDKPYSRFVAEQIAGDLLATETESLVATAFLALGPTNYERQDKDTLEMDVIDEQLDTLGRAFLGMTIGCARCHDHKFDPIPTRDYYALAGILRSTQTLIHDNVSRWVDVPLPLAAEQEAAMKKHEAAVAALQEKIKLAKAAEQKSGKVIAEGIVKPADLPGIVLDDTQAKKVGVWTHSKFSGSYIGDGYLHDGNVDKGQKTLTFTPEIPKTGRYEVRLAYTPGGNRAPRVPVHILHLDGEYTGYINEQETPPIDGRFVSLGTYRFDRSGQWYVLISNEGTTGHVIVDAVQLLPEPTASGGRKPPENENKPLDSRRLEEQLKLLTDNGPTRPIAMGVKEAAHIEDAYVCIRGLVNNRGDKVPRGFLQVLSPGVPASISARESGRLQLAAWLCSPSNPLTARVMVNRVWHYLFGTGIVRTVDVFGTTGEPPSHPELLDYLALEFMGNKERGWSIKTLIRSIVLSRTYQLAGAASAAARANDPENRLLSHANRRRLDAEALRDSMLAVSGQLDRTAGGPSIRKGTTSETGYVFDDRRRSVYTPIFRNRLLELFEVFDFADPNLVGGRRNVSTVATQALFLLNSPFLMEQARQAARAALVVNRDDEAKLTRAYRTALGRLPTERERDVVNRFLSAKTTSDQRQACWERVYQALFASIDFRYVE
jgi:hypothetical protein